MSQPSITVPHPKPPVTAAEIRQLIDGLDTLIDRQKLNDNTPFRDAGADSFDLFTLILAIQDAYDIVIPDNDIAKISTLTGVDSYLSERLS